MIDVGTFGMESGELPFPCYLRPPPTITSHAITHTVLPAPSLSPSPFIITVIVTGSATAGRSKATNVATQGRGGRRPSLLTVPSPRLPAKGASCQGHVAGPRASPVGVRGAGVLATVHVSLHNSRAIRSLRAIATVRVLVAGPLGTVKPKSTTPRTKPQAWWGGCAAS